MWGETDAGLAKTAVAARALGIKTLLKPHVWVRHGAWQGDIAMTTDADWERWFASYEAFILHYAALAEANGFEALAVGTELAKASRRTSDWKRVIAEVRKVYHGKLTYCANWNDEVEATGFWDDLDFIGVQAYYPLATIDDPSKADIEAAWAPIVKKLEALGRRTGKPVVFTEVGFKSHAGSLKQPWVWDTDGTVDFPLQRDAFAALFETFWGKPWFGGTFVWKWHPSARELARAERDFTHQGVLPRALAARFRVSMRACIAWSPVPTAIVSTTPRRSPSARASVAVAASRSPSPRFRRAMPRSSAARRAAPRAKAARCRARSAAPISRFTIRTWKRCARRASPGSATPRSSATIAGRRSPPKTSPPIQPTAFVRPAAPAIS
jgi:hypothetical protein